MKTLNELNLNFKTVENSIKTVGTIVIVMCSIALVINMIINPVAFNF